MRVEYRRLLAEGIGTFCLVLIGPGAIMVNTMSHGVITHVGVSFAFATVVMAMVYAIGSLSGAHINPAVTIALWSVNRFPGREVLPYILAQCSGAVSASLVLRTVLGPVGALGATIPSIAVSGAFVIEVLLSFILMFVIMAVATGNRAAAGFAPIVIGCTVGLCALMGGPLTGASMNPARSFGPAVAGGGIAFQWLYWVAPVVGMSVAAHLYRWLYRVEFAEQPS